VPEVGLDWKLHWILISSSYKHGTNVELLKAMQEMMETQTGSLTSWINASQENMDANLKDIIVEMRAW
jgi:hypothetical protein